MIFTLDPESLMRILVINSGSATLKYRVFDAAAGRLVQLSGGTAGVADGYRPAVERVVAGAGELPHAIAHRVVHGGDHPADVALIDDALLRELHTLGSLAPLHNGPALEGIEATRGLGVPLIAAFDTAFHRTLPGHARRYALPDGLDVRRYGFHGWSHRYVAERYAELARSPNPTIITLHLGSGCSAAAIERGCSVDTSMGYSPLEGLVMETRPGDLDPGILLHLLRQGVTPDRLEQMLNHESGLLALAGTRDMRELLSRSDPAAHLAVEIFCYRIRKYVGAYLAVLDGAEAIVFTGGIGENAPEIRRRVCRGFGWAGLEVDPERNARGDGRISTGDSRLAAFAIPTDEERLIAQEAVSLLRSATGSS